MFKHIAVVLIFVFLLIPVSVCGAEDRVSSAVTLIEKGSYAEAIKLLDAEISQNPKNADAYLQIARAYHWKKEFDKAYGYYRKATLYRPEYKTEIIPLLDEMEKWEEIISIAKPEIDHGLRDPGVLGAVLTAYARTGETEAAAKILQILTGAEYKEQWQKDYRNYVLSYWYLEIGDPEKAMAHLKKIKGAAYRQYAKTSPKFKKLYNDPEFIKLTK